MDKEKKEVVEVSGTKLMDVEEKAKLPSNLTRRH